MRYFMLIHKEGEGFWGECPQLPGCFSQGETEIELMENMKEAVSLYLEEDETPLIVHEVRELVV